MLTRLTFSILAMLTLTACSTTPRPAPEKLPLPLPEPIVRQNIEWVIISTPDGDFYAVRKSEMDKLTANDLETLRWVKEAQVQLRYYRGEDVERKP